MDRINDVPKKVLIRNAEILIEPNGIRGQIAIENGMIVYVGSDDPVNFKPDEIIDADGMLATQGMVNTHCHVSMTLLRSYADDVALQEWLTKYIWPVEAKLTPDDIYWGAMLGIAEMLKSGTTCFADMYFEMDRVAEAAAELGIRANLCESMLSIRPSDPELAGAFYDRWHGYDNDRIRVTYGPHAPYTVDDEYFKKIIASAKKRNAEIQIHLCETKREVEDSIKQYSMTPVERLDKLGLFDLGVIAAHCVHLTENDMEIMLRKKVRVAHNPQSNLKLASGIAPIPAMYHKGITIGLGTDGASSNNNLDMLEEIRSAALIHKAFNNPIEIPDFAAWKMGTMNGAKVLGFDNLGQLEPGQQADIVLWNMEAPYWYPRHNKMSLLVYAANSRDADTVFVAGRKVVEGGKLLTFDEKKIYEEAQKHAMDLITRAKNGK